MLAKAGYWGANPCEIWNAPVNEVIEQYFYEMYIRDYEIADYELNKENK